MGGEGGMGEETKILQQFSYKKIDNFINNEEHDSKIFIQKYLYNKVKIELHYSIARITRHVKFKARHVLILRKRRKTRTNNCFLTKNKQCTLFLAVVVSEFFSFFLFHLTYSHICIGTEGEKKRREFPFPIWAVTMVTGQCFLYSVLLFVASSRCRRQRFTHTINNTMKRTLCELLVTLSSFFFPIIGI